MDTGQKTRFVLMASVLFAMMSSGPVCEVAPVAPADGQASADGGDTAGDDAAEETADGSESDTSEGMSGTGAESEEGNPDSPCPDTTNLYVRYVNESAARIVLVENFRDQDNQSLSASIRTLQAAGDSGDVVTDCIACPYEAGIRNIRYVEDGVTTSATFPEALFPGSFSCGDQMTFTFQADYEVVVDVTTP